MRRNLYSIILLIFYFTVTLGILFYLPNIERPLSDPYFFIESTPILYWVGFGICLFFVILYVISYLKNITYFKDKSVYLISLIFLAIFIYVIPQLFYINKIYIDTYLFVGELVEVLRKGHTSYGWSIESPALSIFSSSIVMITGINYTLVVQLMFLLIPFLYMLFIYVNSKIFIEKNALILVIITFIALNWFGFLFNRQSFALILQILTFYCVIKVITSQEKKYSQYIIMMLSFISLVISHPASPLIIIINIFFIILIIIALNYLPLNNFNLSDEVSLSKKTMLIRSLIIFPVFSVIWLSWQIYIHGAIFIAYRNLINAISIFLISPNPTAHITGIISRYSDSYYPIVLVRLFEAFFVTIIGNILSIILILKTRKLKNILLSSWFMGSNIMIIFVLYARGWLFRPIIYALPSISILITLFIQTTTLGNNIKRFRKVSNLVKNGLLSVIIIMIMVLPILMYSHTPFWYPPTSYLNELNFINKHASGPTVVFEAGSDYRYYVMLNNGSLSYLTFLHFYNPITGFQMDRFDSVNVICTSFRVYTKNGFVSAEPSVSQIASETERLLLDIPEFGRVYNSDLWNKVFIRTIS